VEDVLSGRELRGEPLRCPIDGSRLVQTERSEILVDACPECRGVWLDRGELDRILVKERQWAAGDPDEDFFREAEGRRPPPRERERYDDSDRDEYGGRRKKRRGGFLEDLFEGFGD
jgi:Zn-finger nucleic acid-binding protein